MIDIVTPAWAAPANVGACCTTRQGGCSAAPFDSFNLGMHVGDRESDVILNRQRLRDQLALPNEPEWIRQTHSTEVVTLERDAGRDADAAITRVRGVVATVMTADCLPILLCHREGREVAAVHAGWRGLQGGIIQATLSAMQSSGADLLAWIGPGISQACFEVGDEVRAAFIDANPATASRFESNRAGHWLCDLAGIAVDWLAELGVNEVVRSPNCSYLESDLFYSYRREGVTGRMASLIWIK